MHSTGSTNNRKQLLKDDIELSNVCFSEAEQQWIHHQSPFAVRLCSVLCRYLCAHGWRSCYQKPASQGEEKHELINNMGRTPKN